MGFLKRSVGLTGANMLIALAYNSTHPKKRGSSAQTENIENRESGQTKTINTRNDEYEKISVIGNAFRGAVAGPCAYMAVRGIGDDVRVMARSAGDGVANYVDRILDRQRGNPRILPAPANLQREGGLIEHMQQRRHGEGLIDYYNRVRGQR